ncbi:elongation factor P hydroxylase [Aliidiomarina celeris]|uniref:elongation factor P hydroxylase n=1 Tax=Aliidiomarina celeris TaxID=2249428 RepID=UPI000DEBD9FC|nr:elongation factor P hydroxylase [Aliidiomarina celeris]
MTKTHFCVEELAALFNAAFLQSHNTRLVASNGEPIYRPASSHRAHCEISYAHGFYRSALHEIAHWCVAGKVRRYLLDYGYWYKPDGRNAEQQAAFEAVEVKPQAYEWLLSLSCGHSFEVSLDNLQGCYEPDRLQFTECVIEKAQALFALGLNARLAKFCGVLQQHYQQPPLCERRLHVAGERLLEPLRALERELA